MYPNSEIQIFFLKKKRKEKKESNFVCPQTLRYYFIYFIFLKQFLPYSPDRDIDLVNLNFQKEN